MNGDGKFDAAVDKREMLITGFNGRQHDHSLHSVTAGPDGQWYWNGEYRRPVHGQVGKDLHGQPVHAARDRRQKER